MKTIFSNNCQKSIFAFALFNSWVLSFAYEGQILYSLLDGTSYVSSHFILLSILSHATGLFVCRFIARDINSAKQMMMLSALVCLICSAVYLLPVTAVWIPSIIVAAFFAGLWNASWGYFFRYASKQEHRMKMAAASLATATTLMVFLNVIALNIDAHIALIFAMAAVGASLFVTRQLFPQQEENTFTGNSEEKKIVPIKTFMLICIFIFIVTFGSGLMFSVVNPAYAYLTVLTSWYWAVPYIAAMIIVALLPAKIHKSNILYIALAMIGFGYIAFELLNRSAGSYLLVNTLLLGAFGMTDLFIWSTLGELSECADNPLKVIATGLSINVISVLAGEIFSINSMLYADYKSSLLGISIVISAFVVLPFLFKQLDIILKKSGFAESAYTDNTDRERSNKRQIIIACLSEREKEIIRLMTKGYTYKLIAKELCISENTVKTHIQNIYTKLAVNNKTELIEKLK